MSELGRLSSEEFREAPKIPLWIVLDNVRSGLNVGGIFRTGDAFRVESIYCCGYTPAPPQRDVLKSALGATETVHFEQFTTALEAVHFLRDQGIVCYAVEQTKASIDLLNFKVNSADKIALVFGNEVNGVDQAVIDACDGSIEIRQAGTKHSLNVTVCAGILIHHLHCLFQSTK